MLKIVRCEIISMTRNDTIDAYVLRYYSYESFRIVKDVIKIVLSNCNQNCLRHWIDFCGKVLKEFTH